MAEAGDTAAGRVAPGVSAFAQYGGYGEAMAVLAALIFAWTSIFFTTAGQRLGVTTVNLLRLPIAALCLGITHLLVTGRLVPEHLDLAAAGWIGLSGVVGLAVGDSALFRSFTLIGPRRGMMMMAAAPLFTVVVAWFLLDESLGAVTLLGMAAIIGGSCRLMLPSLRRVKIDARSKRKPSMCISLTQ